MFDVESLGGGRQPLGARAAVRGIRGALPCDLLPLCRAAGLLGLGVGCGLAASLGVVDLGLTLLLGQLAAEPLALSRAE